MAENNSKTQWRDWTLFGLRWLFLIGVSLVIFLTRSQDVTYTSNYTDLAILFGVGVIINLIIAVMILIPSLAEYIPTIATFSDWGFTIGYIVLVNGDPLLMLAILSSLIAMGMLRLGPTWGPVHAFGIAVATVGTLVYLLDINVIMENPQTVLVEPYLIPFVILALISSIIGIWVYFEYGKADRQQRRINEIAELREKQLTDMRERARAMSDMAETLSGTLKFQKILDAALDIGRISLRTSAKQRVISIVLLFRASDESLYIANSRGLNHIDQERSIAGAEGIIGKALAEGVPQIEKDAYSDPELRSFNAFQGIRSILVIPLRAHFDNYGVLIYGSTAPKAFNEDHIDTLMAIGVQATVALQNATLYNNLMNEKDRIIQMEEDARKSLVRDLHDVPTQTISAVAMRLRIAMRMMEKTPQDVYAELEGIEEMTLRATEEIRHVLFKLRPLALESQGLSAALHQLADKLDKTYGQAVAMRITPEIERVLDENKQGALFYLIEEAVNNARKYAEAKLISVTIQRQSDTMLLRIADNGKGFDTDAKSNDGRDHFGMINMRERAELIDGTLTVRSVIGRGTTINVTIPVDASQESRDRTRQLRQQIPDTKLAVTAMSNYDTRESYNGYDY
ncbi:MAG: GAF domain-containing sensor histidine kinase [Aggregatilineales bacterium]